MRMAGDTTLIVCFRPPFLKAIMFIYVGDGQYWAPNDEQAMSTDSISSVQLYYQHRLQLIESTHQSSYISPDAQ